MRELTIEEMDCVSGGGDWTEEFSAQYNANNNTLKLTYGQQFDQYRYEINATVQSGSVNAIGGTFSYNGTSYNFEVNPQNGAMSGTYTQPLPAGWSGTFNVSGNGSGGTSVGIVLTRSF